MSNRTYTVDGMTCGHCVSSITSAVQAVPGVTQVDVDLEGKQVRVDADPLDDAAVRAAIEEAGYEVVG